MMLSPQDHKLFHDLCAFSRGTLSRLPELKMSPWNPGLATQDRFPVILLAENMIVTVIDRAFPPAMSPEMEGLELDVRALGLDHHFE